jgi:hypothetical protein
MNFVKITANNSIISDVSFLSTLLIWFGWSESIDSTENFFLQRKKHLLWLKIVQRMTVSSVMTQL